MDSIDEDIESVSWCGIAREWVCVRKTRRTRRREGPQSCRRGSGYFQL